MKAKQFQKHFSPNELRKIREEVQKSPKVVPAARIVAELVKTWESGHRGLLNIVTIFRNLPNDVTDAFIDGKIGIEKMAIIAQSSLPDAYRTKLVEHAIDEGLTLEQIRIERDLMLAGKEPREALCAVLGRTDDEKKKVLNHAELITIGGLSESLAQSARDARVTWEALRKMFEFQKVRDEDYTRAVKELFELKVLGEDIVRWANEKVSVLPEDMVRRICQELRTDRANFKPRDVKVVDVDVLPAPGGSHADISGT